MRTNESMPLLRLRCGHGFQPSVSNGGNIDDYSQLVQDGLSLIKIQTTEHLHHFKYDNIKRRSDKR